MKTFLFQGDSITDADRSRNNDDMLGCGYATIAAGMLMSKYPGEIRCINRGISGDRSINLLARIKVDFINLKPDYISILIGVNDAWHDTNIENPNGVCVENYEEYLDMLISKLKKALPDTKIFILEPFLLKGSATTEKWNYFNNEVLLRAKVAKAIAEKYGLPFVPLQEMLDKACEKAPAEWWLLDGVHPSVAGHTLIAKELVKVVEVNL
ncbi:MAG TPA: SGNH/GDSL hydrolase family protein [Clostridiales bacterium]|nr:SGNH/GDSL hydrolase family protein [Clostridiales bacterium]